MTLFFLVEFVRSTGGMVQSVMQLINGLSVLPGFRVVLISPRGSEISTIKFNGDVENITTDSDDWALSRHSVLKAWTIALDISRKTRKFRKARYYYICNGVGASILVSMMPLLHKREIYVNRGGRFDSKGFGERILKAKIRFGLISQIVATSRKQVEIINQVGQPLDRITLIHNGITPPKTKYEFHAISNTRLRISTIGYISDLKNQIEGVRLIKQLQNCSVDAWLNVYGAVGSEADKEYKRVLDSEIAALGVSDRVIFKGFVRGEDLFAETDILISFSKAEGFGRTIVEGMMRKIPVIAFRGAGGPVDITDDGKYGYLVDVNQASDYCDLIMGLLNNPEKCQENVEEAYAYANSHFSESRMVGDYVAFFNTLP